MNDIERGEMYIIGQELKERRRLKKVDMPVSGSNYLLPINRETMEC